MHLLAPCRCEYCHQNRPPLLADVRNVICNRYDLTAALKQGTSDGVLSVLFRCCSFGRNDAQYFHEFVLLILTEILTGKDGFSELLNSLSYARLPKLK